MKEGLNERGMATRGPRSWAGSRHLHPSGARQGRGLPGAAPSTLRPTPLRATAADPAGTSSRTPARPEGLCEPDRDRPSQGRGLERSHRLGPACAPCVRPRVCVCLSGRASPRAGASLSTCGQCWPGSLPAQRDLPWGRGGAQGPREPRGGAAGTDQERWAARRRRA